VGKRRAAAMWTLAVDVVTAEVVTAFDEAGVESILLKGPAIAAWLYEDPAGRPYMDTDLLVGPAATGAARTALEARGFHADFGPLPHPGMESPPSHPWRRDSFVVDLHETLPGATAERGRAWTVLRAQSTEVPVGGRPVRALGEPGRLAHVALHAAHHGPAIERPVEDLRRALSLVGEPGWRSAAKVADAIGASAAFAAGLSLLPEGRRLLARLGIEVDRSSAALHGVPVAGGIERLSAAPGVAAKGAILRAELLPSAEFMRWWSPLARRSRRGLLAAYLWRWLYLLWHAPAALRARRGAW
jgi:hypothetical protein